MKLQGCRPAVCPRPPGKWHARQACVQKQHWRGLEWCANSFKLLFDATRTAPPGDGSRRSPGRKAFRDEGHLRLKQGIWLMGIDSVIVWLIVGAIAGWLAGLIVKGGGFGLLGNIVIGIVGAVVAGWLLPQLGIRLGTGIVSAIINAAIGGVIVLVILSLIRRA
jgi:uncharacterized membrane protein YeaQ/YmgE (transglycosylase-associated protein family)